MTRYALSPLALALLVGCAGPSVSPGGATVARADAVAARPMIATTARKGYVYVSNAGTPSISYYAPDADGDVSPVGVISGSKTGLVFPNGLVTDRRGQIYVVNGRELAWNQILVFPPKANGNVRPRVIEGSKTLLNVDDSVTVDDAGYIYVSNCGSYCNGHTAGSIAVFAPHSHGNVAPVRLITGALTQLNGPAAIAVDSTGTIYDSQRGSNAVAVFAPGANGNVAPQALIAGSNTMIQDPNGMAVGSDGIYVTTTAPAVLRFPLNATGNVAPESVISGENTELTTAVDGMGIGKHDSLWIAGGIANNQVLHFPALANGDVFPSGGIGGPHTQLNGPVWVTYGR
jgi:sugar lactone lactonase YvrE